MFPISKPTAAQPVPRKKDGHSSATATRKRSLAEPTTTAGVKRSRNAGPFFDESESDSTENGYEDTRKTTSSPLLRNRQSNRLSLSSLQAKALNSSRLRALINKTPNGPAPHNRIQREDDAKPQNFTSSVNGFQQKLTKLDPIQQQLPSRSALVGSASARSGDTKPRSSATKSLDVPTASGQQVRDSARMRQAQTRSPHPGSIIISESLQKKSFTDTASSDRRLSNVDRNPLRTPKEGTNITKTENDRTASRMESATITAHKNFTPKVAQHFLETGTIRPLQKPGFGKAPAHWNTKRERETTKEIPLNTTTSPRKLSVVQSRDGSNFKSTVGAPQPSAHTHVHTEMKVEASQSAEDESSIQVMPQPVRHGVQTGAGANQKLREQINSEEFASRKAYSSQSQSMPLSTISNRGSNTPQAFPLSPLTPVIEAQVQDTLVHKYDPVDDMVFLNTSGISERAEPYFEYSIFEKTWSNSELEDEKVATELTSQPFTNMHHTNTHAHRLFQSAKEKYTEHFHYQLTETATKRDKHGCETHTGTFASIGNPDRLIHVRLWVRRDRVSVFANQEPARMNLTPFTMKSAFIVRLFKLVPVASSAPCPGGSHDSNARIRVYHPLQRTEVYTTLESANCAARDVQVELSHDLKATGEASVKTRELYIRELNARLYVLNGATDGDGGYWKSRFSGWGDQPVDDYELVVEEVGLCGPRNL